MTCWSFTRMAHATAGVPQISTNMAHAAYVGPHDALAGVYHHQRPEGAPLPSVATTTALALPEYDVPIWYGSMTQHFWCADWCQRRVSHEVATPRRCGHVEDDDVFIRRSPSLCRCQQAAASTGMPSTMFDQSLVHGSICLHLDNASNPAQDVVVGKPVRPQLAKAAKGPQEALDAMKGKPFLLETKFDGEVCVMHSALHTH